MSISITDMTPSVSEIEFAKIRDAYGKVIVFKGWR